MSAVQGIIIGHPICYRHYSGDACGRTHAAFDDYRITESKSALSIPIARVEPPSLLCSSTLDPIVLLYGPARRFVLSSILDSNSEIYNSSSIVSLTWFRAARVVVKRLAAESHFQHVVSSRIISHARVHALAVRLKGKASVRKETDFESFHNM